MSAICFRCNKTVYVREEVKSSGDKHWHKACFKCKSCNCDLDQKSAVVEAKTKEIYCKVHIPKEKHTAVVDISMKTALNAPKKETESTGNAQKGGAKTGAGQKMVESKAPAEQQQQEQPQEQHQEQPQEQHQEQPQEEAPAHHEEQQQEQPQEYQQEQPAE